MLTIADKLQKWRGPLIAFAIGQPAVQLLNLLTGFLLIRWLSVTAYAQFGLAFAFQSTVSQLTDLGFSGSIIALAGERARDPKIIGRYIRAARHYRNRIMLPVMAGALVAFPLLTQYQPWAVETKILLLIALLFGVVAQGWVMYSAPLLTHHRLRQYYQPQIVGAAGRLGLSFVAHTTGVLTSTLCTWLGVVPLALNGWSYRNATRRLCHEPDLADATAKREMIRYLTPLIPGILFTAAQGQITIAIITLFGATRNVAEVAALGRLGQLFLLLGAFNSVLIGPHLSSLPATKLSQRYMQVLVCSGILVLIVAVAGFCLPDLLLWVLGPKYANLRGQIGWVVATGCVSHLCGVFWTMHAARRWVFWWSTILYISLTTAAQITCALLLDLSRTSHVIYFGFVTAIAALLVHVSTGIFGFLRSNDASVPNISTFAN